MDFLTWGSLLPQTMQDQHSLSRAMLIVQRCREKAPWAEEVKGLKNRMGCRIQLEDRKYTHHTDGFPLLRSKLLTRPLREC